MPGIQLDPLQNEVLYQLVKAVASSLEVRIPNALRGPGGVLRPGTMGTRSKKLLINQVIPTERRVPHSRPDLVVRVEREKTISIMDVACAWDTSIHKRRKEKMDRYVELAADMANQHPGYRVVTVPVVVGDLGTIEKEQAVDRRPDHKLHAGSPTRDVMWFHQDSKVPPRHRMKSQTLQKQLIRNINISSRSSKNAEV